MRLIDADALMQWFSVGYFTELINEQPTIEERKEGKWIVNLYKLGRERFECDQCHGRSGLAYDFCPNCGADMRGGQDDLVSD